MKDFDVERARRHTVDREFKIGGETFVRRASVRPEATAAWEDVNSAMPQAEILEAIDLTVCGLIEDTGGAHKRWLALRAREEDALALGDMLELVSWLIAEQAARPTTLPESSSDAPASSGTRSTAASSSRGTRKARKGSTSAS